MPKTNVIHSAVRTRDGDELTRLPMAEYCEPSQRAIARARAAVAEQRALRERTEAMQLLEANGWNQHAADESAADYRLNEPDPLLENGFVYGLITGAILASSAIGLLFLGRA